MDINQIIFRFVIAGLIGAIIGLEREKAKELNKSAGPIGIRTEILTGLLGASAVLMSQYFGNWIFILGFVAVLIFSFLPVLLVNNEANGSYKTSISTVIVYLMGALAFLGQMQVALAIAIITTFVLSIKYTLHKFIYGISYTEIIDAAKFVIIAFIILPFLPNLAYDQQILGFFEPVSLIQASNDTATNIINPYRIWLLIVIISGLNFLGYILVKIFGR
ncbi:MgtC/SapB family protein, partial [Candidatus Peregrinibacteria bacterium]|nr:MgtC/SapB family protein [Candidatus Peregrinibacteria bacterium]